jgi:PAS domain S-box-containing protein
MAESAMSDQKATPTGREVRFADDEIIVSKTDLQGRILYANDVFLRVAGYRIDEVVGKPHSLIRHPDMPRAVFKLLWDEIQAGREIFAYVVNLAKNGDHYWVLAHVTPSFDARGRVGGYHSNRRTAAPEAVAAIKPLYAAMLAAERGKSGKDESIAAGTAVLLKELDRRGLDYERFVWSLEPEVVATKERS